MAAKTERFLSLEQSVLKAIHDNGIAYVSRTLIDFDVAERLCFDNNLRCDFWDRSEVYEFRKDSVRWIGPVEKTHVTIHSWMEDQNA